MFGYADHPPFGPWRRDHSKRREIVITGDFAKLGVKFNVYPEPRKRFEITAEALGRRVEDPVRRFRIVKPIAKRTIRARKRPIWRFPGIGAAADPEDRSAGINTERNVNLPRRTRGQPPGVLDLPSPDRLRAGVGLGRDHPVPD